MSASRREMEARAARLLSARGEGAVPRPAAFAARRRQAAIAPADARPAAGERTARDLDFSLMFFSAVAGEAPRPDLYRLVLEAARFADAAGFSAVWLPERHFHAFGGPYPNPSVLAAGLATVTERIRLRAGSVVLPLHHPLEVTEAWGMVDNLSGGRVEIAFGSGWNPDDFVLSPGTFDDARDVFRRRVDEVRALWRGEPIDCVNGRGETVATRTFPRPVQPELPVWISATGNPDTFAWAGERGFGVLTMLLGGEVADLAPKIDRYREARRAAGLDPDGGRVALMLHTFVHPDGDHARATIREPFLAYVRSSVDVQRKGSAEGRATTEEQRERMVAYAFERYTRSAALFGTPDECRPMLERVAAAGVTEVACLVDFGVEEEAVLGALRHLDALRPARPDRPRADRPRADRPPTADAAPPAPAPRRKGTDEPIAIVGMAGRFPQSDDVFAFWDNLLAGRDLLSPPPPGRSAQGLPPRGGFLDDVAGFAPALFGIAPAEAAAMDPHQRLFLELTWAALENAGIRPGATRGSATGVFAAVYSHSHEAALRARGEALDGLAVAGAVLSMVPNRTSFAFDWRGPSEAVNTACSSGLVAVHRAVAALRAGECDMAVAGGVSLLLAPEETAALARLGILSPTGTCRAFDRRADGQVRGEGGGVLVLKRLSDAQGDGDAVHARLLASAVNHNGARANSLTLPNARRQAACMVDAVRRAGVPPGRIAFIEAHGAGTAAGDLSELAAFASAFRTLGEAPRQAVRVGSVKPNIGSLDAAGGIAGLVKAALAVRHGTIPPTINRAEDPEGHGADGLLAFPDRAEPWPVADGDARVASVHAYGLGGTNAHVVLDAEPAPPRSAAPLGPQPVILSAPDEASLRATVARLLAFLDGAAEPPALADLARTLWVGRERLACRWSATVHDVGELKAAMRGWLAGAPSPAPTEREAQVEPVGGRRIPLPGTVLHPPRAVAGGGEGAGVVAAFYDFVTRAEEREGDVFLTLAPLERVVPGFSWTRTFQDPERHPGHWALVEAAQREMREVLFSAVDFGTVRRVLDFGCGVGSDLVALGRTHPHIEGVGYTISPRQAGIAAARIARAGLAGRVEVFERDSARDPFPGVFDLAIGFEVAHHVADKEGLFSNIAGHLREEGWLVLADCAANTVAPIELPAVGSFTSPKADYADLLAAHGLEIVECVDVSAEIANFLHDPGLEEMIAAEEAAAGGEAALMAAVQRSWDGFGKALRSGLLSYLLLTARKRPGAAGLAAANRRQLEVA